MLKEIKNNFYIYLIPFFLVSSRLTAELTIIFSILFFLYNAFKNNNWNWIKDDWFKVAIIFVSYLILNSLFISPNIIDSILYSITFIRWPLFAISISYILFSNKNKIKHLFFSLLFFLLFFSFDLWYQFINEFDLFGNQLRGNRLTAFIGDNIISGRFIILFSTLIIFLYFNNDLQKKNYLNPIIFLIFLCAIFCTLSIIGERMSFLLGLYTLTCLILIYFTKGKNYYLKIFTFLFFISIFFIFLSNFFPNQYERIINSTFEKLLNFKNSDYGIIYQTCFNYWTENNKIFGNGYHQFKEVIIQSINFPIKKHDVLINSISHPHNIPIQLLFETGLIGLFLFYLTIIKLLIKIINTKNYLFQKISSLNIILISFFPLMSHFSFQNNWINASSWFIIGVALGVSMYQKKTNALLP